MLIICSMYTHRVSVLYTGATKEGQLKKYEEIFTPSRLVLAVHKNLQTQGQSDRQTNRQKVHLALTERISLSISINFVAFFSDGGGI